MLIEILDRKFTKDDQIFKKVISRGDNLLQPLSHYTKGFIVY